MKSLTHLKYLSPSVRMRAVALATAIMLYGAVQPVPFFAASSSAANSSANGKPTAAKADTACSQQLELQSCDANSPVGADEDEILMWRLINRDRSDIACQEETRGKARPLQWDPRLAAIARQHSQEMAANRFFSHSGTDGSSPDARLSRAGIKWRATGENIAKFDDVPGAEAAFMNEPKFQPNHRGNILNPDYTHVGVGIARGESGILYITQEFAQLH